MPHQPSVRPESVNDVVLNGVGVVSVRVEMPGHQRGGCTAAIDISQIVSGVAVPIADDWLRAGWAECDHRVIEPGENAVGPRKQMPD